MSWFKGMFFSRSYNEAVNCHPIPPIREDTHTPIVREPEIEPNWVHEHGNYTRKYVCHCGCTPTNGRYFENGICPECGCKDYPSEEIGRYEWERNLNHQWLRWEIPSMVREWREDIRNCRWVKKPDGACGKVTE